MSSMLYKNNKKEPLVAARDESSNLDAPKPKRNRCPSQSICFFLSPVIFKKQRHPRVFL